MGRLAWRAQRGDVYKKSRPRVIVIEHTRQLTTYSHTFYRMTYYPTTAP